MAGYRSDELLMHLWWHRLWVYKGERKEERKREEKSQNCGNWSNPDKRKKPNFCGQASRDCVVEVHIEWILISGNPQTTFFLPKGKPPRHIVGRINGYCRVSATDCMVMDPSSPSNGAPPPPPPPSISDLYSGSGLLSGSLNHHLSNGGGGQHQSVSNLSDSLSSEQKAKYSAMTLFNNNVYSPSSHMLSSSNPGGGNHHQTSSSVSPLPSVRSSGSNKYSDYGYSPYGSSVNGPPVSNYDPLAGFTSGQSGSIGGSDTSSGLSMSPWIQDSSPLSHTMSSYYSHHPAFLSHHHHSAAAAAVSHHSHHPHSHHHHPSARDFRDVAVMQVRPKKVICFVLLYLLMDASSLLYLPLWSFSNDLRLRKWRYMIVSF